MSRRQYGEYVRNMQDNVFVTEYRSRLEKRKMTLFWKRAFDIAASFFGICLMLLPFFVIAVLIKTDSPGPVFFKQVRVGRYGKEFRIWKFRTMIPDAETKGRQITVGRDARITRVGGKLRKLKIDEFPQLFNILAGSMSFVGPRPEVPGYVKMYREEQLAVLLLKPGMTDLASIRYKDESELLAQSDDPDHTYVNEIMPAKLEIHLDYLKNFSFFGDIYIIFQTFFAVFFK